MSHLSHSSVLYFATASTATSFMASSPTPAVLSLTQPLIPLGPDAIRVLDLLLPPLLIALAVIIYDLQSHPSTSSSSASSHVFTNHTLHSRLLPSCSRHSFDYRVIQFGLDLDHLESGRLDVPYLFKFITHPPGGGGGGGISLLDPSSWLKLIQIYSISPSSYHKNKQGQTNKPSSIKLALLDQLRDGFGISDAHDRIGKVYLLTMPTYLGFTTINPLSIYFCYHQEKTTTHDSDSTHHPPLQFVLLDVQNTFSERHSYLLTVGLNESPHPPTGRYHHVWTIPRGFHVSPFNDRAGSYRVSIEDPFLNTQNNNNSNLKMNLEIILLTATGQKKFFASLRGTGTPMTKAQLIRTWFKSPFILFLTTTRILYQSLILHMGKPRLDVYPKPDPFFDPDYGSKGLNPVQSSAHIGATGWQEPHWCARWSKQIIMDYLTQRVNQIARAATSQPITKSSNSHSTQNTQKKQVTTSMGSFEHLTEEQGEAKETEELSTSSHEEEERNGQVSPSIITVILKPADQTQQVIKISPDPSSLEEERGSTLPAEDLVIHYSSAGLFNDLILFPTPSLAQVICDESEASWKVSSVATFDKVFENPSLPPSDTSPALRPTGPIPTLDRSHARRYFSSFLLARINQSRSSYLDWQLSFITRDERNLAQLKPRSSWFPPPNFLPIHDDDDDDGGRGSKRRARIHTTSSPLDLALQHSTTTLLAIWLLLTYLSWSQWAAYFLATHVFYVRFVHLSSPWLTIKRAVFVKNHILVQPPHKA